MARIRTIKPEFYLSESLSHVSLTAERTFAGLFCLADDRGRYRDDARVIYGRLWVTRSEQTPAGVEEDLRQLAEHGLICRYTGCDGKRYLHPVTWTKHQKVNNPTKSRLPACPEHHADLECGGCGDEHCTGPAPENFRRTTEILSTVPAAPAPSAQAPAQAPAAVPAPEDRPADPSDPVSDKTAGQGMPEENFRGPSENFRPGSRIKDPGSTPNGDGSAVPPGATASQLVAKYTSLCSKRPPSKTLARLGKEIKDLLADGFTPDQVWAGVLRYHANPKNPAFLPDMVNEALNGARALPGATRGTQRHQAWTNPTDDAYAEEL